MRVLSVVGARPNFVKIAPLLAEMRRCADVEALLVHTGQHNDREMSDCFQRDLAIPPPDFRLTIDASGRAARSEAMRSGLSGVMRNVHPDVVLVVGDVDSTLAGALAAHDLGIPVAHVEAGLRSFDRTMPEEINRILTDSVSSLFFASEPSAVANLRAEGYPAERIFLTGNVMIDTLRRFQCLACRSTILSRLGLLDTEGAAKEYALATLHRPGAVDDATILPAIWRALEEIGTTIPVIFPAHPRTRSRLERAGLLARGECGANGPVRVIPPQAYLDFLCLESEAALVMTDSGGVQEETTALGVPCLTLRNNTERPITITQGTNRLVGLDPLKIVGTARQILSGRFVPRRHPALWDDRSAERVVRVLRGHFNSLPRPKTDFHRLSAPRPKASTRQLPDALPA
jgi:UDP-N-acetylglucosamine 2-epimerase (non-hydrolysing)